MVNLKSVFNFYRFLFKLSLVSFPLPPPPKVSGHRRWSRWVGRVCGWLVNAFLALIILLSFLHFLSLYTFYYVHERYIYENFFRTSYFVFGGFLSFSALLYLRLTSQQLRFGQTLATILKLNEKYLREENKAVGGIISQYFYFSLLILPFQCLKRTLRMDLRFWTFFDFCYFFSLEYYYFNYYLLAHSCLFFCVLMRVLTEVLRPPFPGKPLTPGAYRKYMRLYEEVRGLAAEVNRLFSPLLLLAYVSSTLGVSIFMALSTTTYALTAMNELDFAVFNLLVSLMCLNCIIRCNNRRVSYWKLLHFELSKRTEKRLILCQLDFNTRLIELLMKDEGEWFNVGCFIPVDESILLTVFQTLYDNTLGFKKLMVDIRIIPRNLVTYDYDSY